MTIRSDVLTDRAGTGPASLLGQQASKVNGRYNQSVPALDTTTLNVSSATDNGTGRFTINYVNPLSSADAPTLTSSRHNVLVGADAGAADDTTSQTFIVYTNAGAVFDTSRNSFSIFGDLA